MYIFVFFFFFKQKTAYELRISDWSSDVCSSDLFASYYEKVISVIGSKTSEGKNAQYLAEAYNYLGAYYYTVEKDIDQSIASFEKTLEYDPSNSRADRKSVV